MNKQEKLNNNLINAIYDENLKAMTKYILKGADVNCTYNYDSPIIKSIKLNNIDAVRLLIESGADVNKTSSVLFHPPIIYAIEQENIEIMKLLIDAGANLYFERLDNKNILEYAVYNFLKSNNHNFDVIKTLIEANLNINQKFFNSKSTLLIKMAEYDNQDYLSYLIDKGALLNEKNKDGNSALMIASLYNHIKNIRLLLKNGAMINEQNNGGDTALHLALNEYNNNSIQEKLVKILIDKGFNINIQNNEGISPLMLALKNNLISCAMLLYEAGAKVDLKDKNGKTATDYCKTNGLLKELLSLRENKQNDKENENTYENQ